MSQPQTAADSDDVALLDARERFLRAQETLNDARHSLLSAQRDLDIARDELLRLHAHRGTPSPDF